MKGMIMAAGVGSRLMPLTATMPKPMLPILGRPLMQYNLELLKKYGITEIIANIHHLPETIQKFLKNSPVSQMNIGLSFEEKLLGTAGGVKNNQRFLDKDTFVILSGDALTDIDLKELYKFHKEKKALATIALKPVQDVSNYGVVVLDVDDKIIAFQEKPTRQEALSRLVNTGIYVFEPEIFNYMPKKHYYDFGKELFPLLVEKDLPFFGWKTDDYWSDIGSFDTYKEAQFDLLNNKLNLAIDNVSLDYIDTRLEKYAEIRTVRRSNGKVYIGGESVVENDANLFGYVIIGKNSSIGNRCILHNSVILDNVVIGDNVFITDSIIGNGCLINNNVIVHGNVVVADNNMIESQRELQKGVRIWPGQLNYSGAGFTL